jgi:hypothetical protein
VVVLWITENTLAEVLKEMAALVCINDLRPAHARRRRVGGARRGDEHLEQAGRGVPHAGRFVTPNWQFTDEILPKDFASEAEGWVALGS